MDSLETQTHTRPSKPKSKSHYLKELKEEIRKVQWTTKEELILLAKIVIIATFSMGLSVYGVDLLIKGILNGLRMFFHCIFR